MKLNEAQKKAVSHFEGPMIVLAGPGSGKTRVITHRVKYLVEEKHVAPTSILVITFTKAAAMEMRQRYQQIAPKHSAPVWFGTFHAIFFTILKHAYHYSANNIIRENVRFQLLKEIIETTDVEIQDENEFVNDISSQISLVKGNRMDVSHYYSPTCPDDAFRDIFQKYQAGLQRRRLIDFDDMLVYCYDLLAQRPDIRQAWQKQYPFILIDEFQDINQVQYEVVKLLAEPKNNIFIVGDDDQSIYGFRGARPDIMQAFVKEFAPEQSMLTTNYRCHPEIVRLSGKVIAHNQNRLPKVMNVVADPGLGKEAAQKAVSSSQGKEAVQEAVSSSQGKEAVQEAVSSSQGEEAAQKIVPRSMSQVVSTIPGGYCFGNAVWIQEFQQMKEQNGWIRTKILSLHEQENPYHEIAILFRTNRQARAITSKLTEYNIPFVMKEMVPNLYDHWVVRDILTYIRVALGNRERGNLLRIINRPKRYVHRNAFTEPIMDLEELEKFYEEKEWMIERIENFKEDLIMISGMRPYAAVNFIRRGVGYDDYIREYAEYRGIRGDELYDILDELQEASKEQKNFEEWFQYIQEYGEELKEQVEKSQRARTGKEQKEDAVMICTMHGAKGLEFDYVFIPDANEGITPHNKATLTEDMEEERRMFYVAMTRARKELYISYLEERFNKEVSVSRFVEEILEGEEESCKS